MRTFITGVCGIVAGAGLVVGTGVMARSAPPTAALQTCGTSAPQLRTTLYFGLARPKGSVSELDWQMFLADDFVLVTGRGQAFTKRDLLKDARDKTTIYEHQEEEAGSQTVRVWGDTAVVTALLWIKGTRAGAPIDYKLWFSDTYVRMKD